MNAIKVKKAALVEILTVNRDKHREIFLEAQEGYYKALIAEIEKMLADARMGKKRSIWHIQLVQPLDQTRDYNRVLGMLDMSMDEMIELEEHDYQAYVLDEWGWTKQFSVSNRNYSAKAAAMMAQAD